MNALLLYQRGTRIHHIERSLKYENIAWESQCCDADFSDTDVLGNVDFVVLYALPHPLLRAVMPHLRKEKPQLSLFVIEKNFSEEIAAYVTSLGGDGYFAEPLE